MQIKRRLPRSHNAPLLCAQIMTDPTYFGPDQYGKVIDDVWVIQSQHGPFDLASAPKTEGEHIGSAAMLNLVGAAGCCSCNLCWLSWVVSASAHR